jgi:hypothetical protein
VGLFRTEKLLILLFRFLLVVVLLSRRRKGYGTQYKLVVPPDAIGKVCFPDWWSDLVQRKIQHDKSASSIFNPKNYSTLFSKKSGAGSLLNSINDDEDSIWNKFVGL